MANIFDIPITQIATDLEIKKSGPNKYHCFNHGKEDKSPSLVISKQLITTIPFSVRSAISFCRDPQLCHPAIRNYESLMQIVLSPLRQIA